MFTVYYSIMCADSLCLDDRWGVLTWCTINQTKIVLNLLITHYSVEVTQYFPLCCRYGFDRERCRQALEAGEESGRGEVGATLELLLSLMFTERFGSSAFRPQTSDLPSQEECVAPRQEEALALTAIYGDRFCERISSRVWTIQLDLLWLDERRNNISDSANCKKQSGSNQICKFYLKGAGCRYGNRCKFKHQTLESSSSREFVRPVNQG